MGSLIRLQDNDRLRGFLLQEIDQFEKFLVGIDENGGDKLVHGSGGISQPRAE